MISRFSRFAFVALAARLVVPSFAVELSKAEQEGRALAEELLSQRPAENFVQTGRLKIRDGKSKRTEIPIRFEAFVTETIWTTTYETTSESNHVGLIVTHEDGKPNRYELFKGPPTRIRLPQFLSGNETMTSFAGSDFWVADLGLEFFRWPEQKVLKHEMRRGRPCKVLESVNPAPATNAYSRVVSWIDNETGGIVRAEAYDSDNKLFKDCEPKGFKKIKGRWELREMRIRNLKTGSQTIMEFDLPPE